MLIWYAQERYHPFSLKHEDENPDRPGVLMIHGFTGTPDELRPTAEIAFNAGSDVEVIGIPGMGADIGRFLEVRGDDWLASVMERWDDFTTRYRRRVLLGYSLGAALAIHAAAARPPDELALFAPLVRLADPKAVALPVAKLVLRELTPFKGMDFSQPATKRFFENTMPGLDVDDPETQRAIREDYVLPTRLLNDCRLIGREAGRLARHITVPATIIQGRPDDVVGHHNARWLADHLGGRVSYHEVAGNHLIPFDSVRSWSEVRPLVERLFARIGGGTTG
ncbi:MAG: alpha/beta fold hydrolase [Chloroflexota bacterium]|jgi:carboxylesterase|nr:alpha/beta fold hydrolase [Chloroflexota bacterium]